MSSELKVLTLNCWGVFTPLACQHRHERMTFIGQELSKGDYDIILLQEIWTQSDYEKLSMYITPALPFTHYFHSGLFGTGLCIFSKYPILETAQHTYSLNGYAHMIHHSDWLCGKGVGLAQIQFNDYLINVYSTHLHAQYDEDKDEYLAHRVAQAFEMSQFIKLTSSACDFIIVGGDLNLQPKDLGYKILTSNASLQDAWLTQASEKSDETGSTCDRTDNIYHCKHTLTYAPDGLRIDYILYRGSKGCDVQCDKCVLAMRQIPGKPFPYSDHEGVAANFTITSPTHAETPKLDSGKVEKYLSEALSNLDQGMKKVHRNQVFFGVAFLICLTFLVYIPNMNLPLFLVFLMFILRIVTTIITAYLFWMCVIMSKWEMNGLIAAKKDINNVLKANPNILHRKP